MAQGQNGLRSKFAWGEIPKGKLAEVAKWPKVKMAYDRNSLRSKRTKVKLAKFKPLYMDLVSVIFSDLAFLRRGVK